MMTIGTLLFKLWASGILLLVFATCPAWDIQRTTKDSLWKALAVWLAGGMLIGGMALIWRLT